jgi:hypothetical protein
MDRFCLQRFVVVVAALLLATVQSACRPAPVPAVQSDLNRLRQTIVVPAGTTAARWLISTNGSGGLLPAPGTTVLLARLQMDPDAMKQLHGTGGWSSPDRLPAMLEKLLEPEEQADAVLRCVSPEPAESIIYGTTWMEVEMFVDEGASAVFLILQKS